MALCGISNQITPDNPKPQRMGIQIGPKMAFIWIADEHVNALSMLSMTRSAAVTLSWAMYSQI